MSVTAAPQARIDPLSEFPKTALKQQNNGKNAKQANYRVDCNLVRGEDGILS